MISKLLSLFYICSKNKRFKIKFYFKFYFRDAKHPMPPWLS